MKACYSPLRGLLVLGAVLLLLIPSVPAFASGEECDEHGRWTKTWTDSFGQTTYSLQAPCHVYIGSPFTVTVTATDAVYPNTDVGASWKIKDNGVVVAGGGFNWITTVNGTWKQTITLKYKGTPEDHVFEFSFTDLGQGSGAHFWATSIIGSVVEDPYPTTKIGVYQSGSWYLDANGSGAWDDLPTDVWYGFGIGLDNALPVTGDWNGVGTSRIGVFDSGIWYLDLNGNGAWDGELADGQYAFGVGLAHALPVTGDWTGDGMTRIGVYADGIWYLDLNGNGAWDGEPADGLYAFGVGLAHALPVTGDWTGDGITKIGVYADGIWYLDLSGNGAWDGEPTDGLYMFGVGLSQAVPVTGDWNADGKTEIGVSENGAWYLDLNGNGLWDGEPIDAVHPAFGANGALPVTGKW
ncbi:MAG: hypothetical protein M0042_14220 [Nitrospiraceae bacterium]|nr:hypothetical protein [Nitrospiraceae bacterium]